MEGLIGKINKGYLIYGQGIPEISLYTYSKLNIMAKALP